MTNLGIAAVRAGAGKSRNDNSIVASIDNMRSPNESIQFLKAESESKDTIPISIPTLDNNDNDKDIDAPIKLNENDHSIIHVPQPRRPVLLRLPHPKRICTIDTDFDCSFDFGLHLKPQTNEDDLPFPFSSTSTSALTDTKSIAPRASVDIDFESKPSNQPSPLMGGEQIQMEHPDRMLNRDLNRNRNRNRTLPHSTATASASANAIDSKDQNQGASSFHRYEHPHPHSYRMKYAPTLSPGKDIQYLQVLARSRNRLTDHYHRDDLKSYPTPSEHIVAVLPPPPGAFKMISTSESNLTPISNRMALSSLTTPPRMKNHHHNPQNIENAGMDAGMASPDPNADAKVESADPSSPSPARFLPRSTSVLHPMPCELEYGQQAREFASFTSTLFNYGDEDNEDEHDFFLAVPANSIDEDDDDDSEISNEDINTDTSTEVQQIKRKFRLKPRPRLHTPNFDDEAGENAEEDSEARNDLGSRRHPEVSTSSLLTSSLLPMPCIWTSAARTNIRTRKRTQPNPSSTCSTMPEMNKRLRIVSIDKKEQQGYIRNECEGVRDDQIQGEKSSASKSLSSKSKSTTSTSNLRSQYFRPVHTRDRDNSP